jgi:hypothetical protein
LVDVTGVFVQSAWVLELLNAVSMPLAVYRQALGVSFPLTLLGRADDVIE